MICRITITCNDNSVEIEGDGIFTPIKMLLMSDALKKFGQAIIRDMACNVERQSG